MTATERLRAMLDERGVDWGNVRHDGSESDYFTEWCPDGTKDYASACEWSVGGGLSVKIIRDHCTPEQAIAATLGAGTCRLPETRIDHGSIEYNGTTSWRLCSACGAEVLADPANYCPNCGRKVER